MMILILVLLSAGFEVAHAEMIKVPGGLFRPPFHDKGETALKVDTLYVDETPVTNKKYREFLEKNPQWRKSKIVSLYADETYLKQWTGDFMFPKGHEDFPIVSVSWFAARAYCKAQGGRLPIITEWEYFSESQNPKIEEETLKWYSKAQTPLRSVGQNRKNRFGLYDTQGLVWEWVEDFSSAIMPGDSREGPMKDMFCAGAALGTKDPTRYAAFMRYAYRSSLKANFSGSNLGFRCVRDSKGRN